VTDLPPHKKFERQIERIHRLLETEDSIVTWDDHIPDPDNPSQARQIDVSIRRDSSLTLVECRIHKERQDVNWIEELMGRRISLKADAVIAVSASGFTKTARDKANAHGIHLRDLATLSHEEIQSWGRKRTVTLNFCEFTDATLTLYICEPPPLAQLPHLTGIDGKPPSPLIWRLLWQSIMLKFDENKWTGVPVTIDGPIAASLLINGKSPTSMRLHAKVRRIEEIVQLASVVVYADPITAARHAEVGHYELGASEIIENCDDLAMTIDLSTITVPDNCCLETVTVNAGRIVRARPQFIGMVQALNCRIPIQIRFYFHCPDAHL
jgi:hypothetical protein